MSTNIKFILFCRDFKPLIGGVAEYVSNLAYYLNKSDSLRYVLTHLKQTEDLGYPVKQSAIRHNRSLNNSTGDRFIITRKINTMIHFILLNLGALWDVLMIKVSSAGCKLIVASYYDYQTSIFLNWCSRLKLNYSIVIHGYDILIRTTNGKMNFEAHCKNAEVIIFNSNPTKKLYIETIGAFRNAYILFPGLNAEKIEELLRGQSTSLSEKFHINDSTKLVISTVSRLAKRKGIDIAIRSVVKLHEIRPDVLYIICGKGEELQELTDLIIKCNASNYIKLAGEITESEKFELLSKSKIYLLPTHNIKGSDFEGFGISFIEAEYMGNVVFGGDNDGVTDAVRNEHSGFTMNFDEEGSYLMLAQKINDVLSDEQSMNKISAQAKKWVSANFECRYLTDKLIDYYKKLF